jgi:uncharacterized protein (DUF3820 family)
MSDNPTPHDFMMPFGKHKGKPISQIPTGYLCWAAKQDSLPSEIVQAVKETLDTRHQNKADQEVEPPAPAETVNEEASVDARDFYKERANEAPRQEFKISKNSQYVKVNGIFVRVDEIRSIRPVRTPVKKEDCVLTHVAVMRLGCFGEGAAAPTKIWLTSHEAASIEKLFFE